MMKRPISKCVRAAGETATAPGKAPPAPTFWLDQTHLTAESAWFILMPIRPSLQGIFVSFFWCFGAQSNRSEAQLSQYLAQDFFCGGEIERKDDRFILAIHGKSNTVTDQMKWLQSWVFFFYVV